MGSAAGTYFTPSTFLAEGGQLAANRSGRSLAEQIEHWAWIGKAAEKHLSPASVTALIRCDGNLALLEEDAERIRIEGELMKMRILFGD